MCEGDSIDEIKYTEKAYPNQYLNGGITNLSLFKQAPGYIFFFF